MKTDDETKPADPRKVIADANKMLARLQRDRLGTPTRHCLIAYRSLQPRHPTQDSPFVVDSALRESLNSIPLQDLDFQ